MVARSHQNELIDSCTSGSTGSPLIFSIGRRRSRSDVAARLRAHRWFDVEPGDPGIWLNLGVIRYATGDEAGAQIALSEGLTRGGGFENACRFLGQLFPTTKPSQVRIQSKTGAEMTGIRAS